MDSESDLPQKLLLWRRFETRGNRPKRDQRSLLDLSLPFVATLTAMSLSDPEVESDVVILLGSSP
jgi:hypothetical protein